MQIKISLEQADHAASELLELSRSMRRYQVRMDEVQHQLRKLSGMEECMAALRKQEERIFLSTAQMVKLSSALREITGIYQAAEKQNINRLEERPYASREAGRVTVYGTGMVHERIQKILNKR